jgi:hypothetical protein
MLRMIDADETPSEENVGTIFKGGTVNTERLIRRE